MTSLRLVGLLMALAVSSVYAGCTGNPPTYNGLPCATTTRYWDGQMGACGCGTGNSNPFSWQWTGHTAAASQLLFDEGGSGWCGAGCGACYEITPTGDCTYGTDCATYNAPITIMVTNRCPYQGNEVWCPNPGDTNQYGYKQHFDLMDYQMAGWVDAMGWNNPVVTYRQVPCGGGGSPSCDQAATCQCSTGGQCNQGTVNATTNPTSASASSSSSSSSSSTSTSTTGSPPTTGSAPSPTTSTTGSQPSTGSGSTQAGCSATVVQTPGNSWYGGGLNNVLIVNTGSSPITKVAINLSAGFNGVPWNTDPDENNAGVFVVSPSWAYPIYPGATYSSSGYTYVGDQPTSTLAYVNC